jgi:CBS domain-containing protein
MTEDPRKRELFSSPFPELTDKDIFEAMKAIPGYLDISPADFKEIYVLAFKQARERMVHGVKAEDIMSAPPITVRPDTGLKEIMDLFSSRVINRVPVIDLEGRLLGIITRNDIVKLPGLRPSSPLSAVPR